MTQPLFNASALFRDFEDNLNISDHDEGILRGARKMLRGAIRGDFRAQYGAFIQARAANMSKAQFNAASQFNEERVKFLTQGSFRYGTLNKPQRTPPQQMDLDDGVYFKAADIADRGALDPNLLFAFVEKRIADLASRQRWKMERKPTCVRLEIGENPCNKHIDLPLYIVPDEEFSHFEENAERRANYAAMSMQYYPYVPDDEIWMAHREERWVNSDSRKIIDWVIECKQIYGKRYKTLCRIMKAWRDHQWQNSPLSSICIMRMVEMALQHEQHAPNSNRELDSLLYAVISYMHHLANSGQAIADPADPNKRLDKNMDQNDWAKIAGRLENLVRVMNAVLYTEGLQADKNAKLREQFGRFFPSDSSKISRCAAAAAVAASTVSAAAAPRAYCTTQE